MIKTPLGRQQQARKPDQADPKRKLAVLRRDRLTDKLLGNAEVDFREMTMRGPLSVRERARVRGN